MDYYKPQLATLVRKPPPGDDWLHEIKFDGYRVGCRIDQGRVTLTTRKGNDYTAAFPEIVAAAALLPTRDALIDGEVAVLLADGRTSFQALQSTRSSAQTRNALVFFAFDLLWLDGQSLAEVPLETRKARLHALLDAVAPGRLRFADHVVGDGTRLFAEAQRLGLEGIVSKRRDSRYRPGRTHDWTKAKCTRQRDFVIGGFIDQVGSPGVLGSLVLGHFDDAGLRYAGNVGTGFSRDEAAQLRETLAAIGRTRHPFVALPPLGTMLRRTHWADPRLVCGVSFIEWTEEGRVRQPSYLGLRPGVEPGSIRAEPDADG